MEIKLKYYFILTIDIYSKDQTIRSIKPDIVKYPKFWVTEKTPDDDYTKKHRKYCGILDPQETDEYLRDQFESAENTLGALTMEYGHTPAISFTDYGNNHTINVYVFPVLHWKDEQALMKEMESHPQADNILELVRNEMDKALKVLKDLFDTEEKLPEKFIIDTKQTFLPLKFTEKQEKLCSKCGKNPAQEAHYCPYQHDINGVEDDKYCDCCVECAQDCADSI